MRQLTSQLVHTHIASVPLKMAAAVRTGWQLGIFRLSAHCWRVFLATYAQCGLFKLLRACSPIDGPPEPLHGRDHGPDLVSRTYLPQPGFFPLAIAGWVP
jgi:hypothetical protein